MSGLFPVATPEEAAPVTTFRWATVTAASPLRVRLDGDTGPLSLTPDSLVNPSLLTTGKRVWVQLYGRRVIILGVNKGGI